MSIVDAARQLAFGQETDDTARLDTIRGAEGVARHFAREDIGVVDAVFQLGGTGGGAAEATQGEEGFRLGVADQLQGGVVGTIDQFGVVSRTDESARIGDRLVGAGDLDTAAGITQHDILEGSSIGVGEEPHAGEGAHGNLQTEIGDGEAVAVEGFTERKVFGTDAHPVGHTRHIHIGEQADFAGLLVAEAVEFLTRIHALGKVLHIGRRLDAVVFRHGFGRNDADNLDDAAVVAATGHDGETAILEFRSRSDGQGLGGDILGHGQVFHTHHAQDGVVHVLTHEFILDVHGGGGAGNLTFREEIIAIEFEADIESVEGRLDGAAVSEGEDRLVTGHRNARNDADRLTFRSHFVAFVVLDADIVDGPIAFAVHAKLGCATRNGQAAAVHIQQESGFTVRRDRPVQDIAFQLGPDDGQGTDLFRRSQGHRAFDVVRALVTDDGIAVAVRVHGRHDTALRDGGDHRHLGVGRLDEGFHRVNPVVERIGLLPQCGVVILTAGRSTQEDHKCESV